MYDVNLKKIFQHAEQGYIYALIDLWKRYEDGVGVPKCKIKARECIEKILANPEYSEQFFNRFEALYSGLGSYYYEEKRYKLALEFFVKAKKYIQEHYPNKEHLKRIDRFKLKEKIEELKHLLAN